MGQFESGSGIAIASALSVGVGLRGAEISESRSPLSGPLSGRLSGPCPPDDVGTPHRRRQDANFKLAPLPAGCLLRAVRQALWGRDALGARGAPGAARRVTAGRVKRRIASGRSTLVAI
jgi:hypothetical protein